jgi:hypothetical protein
MSDETTTMESAAELLASLARGLGADGWDVVCTRTDSEGVDFAGGKADQLRLQNDRGLGIRIFRDGRPGYASTGRLTRPAIERMVRDLNFDIKIHRVKIVRDATGLAMSSRNEYLSDLERSQALSISDGLKKAKEVFDKGELRIAVLRDLVIKSILANRGQVQYVEVVNQKNLQKLNGALRPEDKVVILVAAFFGKTRLIDNMELN